jgi:hypothetical protein
MGELVPSGQLGGRGFGERNSRSFGPMIRLPIIARFEQELPNGRPNEFDWNE